MIEGRKNITLAYQMMSQVIVLYFFLYLLVDWLSLPFSLSSYLIVTSAGIAGLLVTTYYQAYKSRVVVVPIIVIGLTFVTGLYWLIGVALAGGLVWRYNAMEVDPEQGNEHGLLIMTTILAFTELVFYRDLSLMVALLLQYVILFMGYNLSHYYRVSKADRAEGQKNILGFAVAIPLATIGLLILLPGVRSVVGFLWSGVSFIFLKGVSGVIAGLQFFGLDVSDIEPSESLDGQQGLLDKMEEMRPQDEATEYDGSVVNRIGDATQWGLIIGILAAVIIVLFIVYRFNKNREGFEDEGSGLSYQSYQLASDMSDTSSMFSFSRSKANNPIRKQFEKFEKNAAKSGVGREPNESINDWFDRIGLETSQTTLYQKVRYGLEELTSEETDRFYCEMKDLQQQIERLSAKKNEGL
ncbi:hypothetical protein H0266_12490 [Halobacillus locisalis]|uniref:DUF4129 domain-containing protein n=1 Tax=Halobacillus locisalis TaxID=220753 RepID=A0A838CUV6_9BACI|nr:hypothetical protein [Halobacillus locisalis]MBA2175711.1 hypothetical protein [Halobacillus locisalis]